MACIHVPYSALHCAQRKIGLLYAVASLAYPVLEPAPHAAVSEGALFWVRVRSPGISD